MILSRCPTGPQCTPQHACGHTPCKHVHRLHQSCYKWCNSASPFGEEPQRCLVGGGVLCCNESLLHRFRCASCSSLCRCGDARSWRFGCWWQRKSLLSTRSGLLQWKGPDRGILVCIFRGPPPAQLKDRAIAVAACVSSSCNMTCVWAPSLTRCGAVGVHVSQHTVSWNEKRASEQGSEGVIA